MKQNPEVNLKFKYRKVFELALVISLAVHIIVLQAFKKLEMKIVQREVPISEIKIEDIPPTEQPNRPPPPERPAVPIATESEDIPEDLTIESTELNLLEEPPPPPPPPEEEEPTVFIAYDEDPYPIGGWEALQERVVYPEIARKAGVEGNVIIYAHIDTKGNVIGTRVLKSLGAGCDEAAIEAIKATKWKPAKQRDMPVAVWVSITIRFRLEDLQ